jgi:hypothetical protein
MYGVSPSGGGVATLVDEGDPVKLPPAARRALIRIATGRELPRSLSTFVAFGDLARLGLIEPNPTVTRWRCSVRGRAVLLTLPRWPL